MQTKHTYYDVKVRFYLYNKTTKYINGYQFDIMDLLRNL